MPYAKEPAVVMLPETVVVLLSPLLIMPNALLTVPVVMLPVPVTVTVFPSSTSWTLVVWIPMSVPIVVKATPRLTVSPPLNGVIAESW